MSSATSVRVHIPSSATSVWVHIPRKKEVVVGLGGGGLPQLTTQCNLILSFEVRFDNYHFLLILFWLLQGCQSLMKFKVFHYQHLKSNSTNNKDDRNLTRL